MKKSIRFLPEKRRKDLQQLVKIILEEIRGVTMIILYGSYANNTYAKLNRQFSRNYSVRFRSTYEILIITEKKLNTSRRFLFSSVTNRFMENKKSKNQTLPSFTGISIKCMNISLRAKKYSCTTIKKDGIILYDAGTFKLARRRKLDYSTIKSETEDYYTTTLRVGDEFLWITQQCYAGQKYNLALFQLHQSTESYFRAVSYTFLIFQLKFHHLDDFLIHCQKFAPEMLKIFSSESEKDKQLFQLLNDAYLCSRYDPNFVATAADIDALIPKIELLRGITEKVCRKQIAHYTQMANRGK